MKSDILNNSTPKINAISSLQNQMNMEEGPKEHHGLKQETVFNKNLTIQGDKKPSHEHYSNKGHTKKEKKKKKPQTFCSCFIFFFTSCTRFDEQESRTLKSKTLIYRNTLTSNTENLFYPLHSSWCSGCHLLEQMVHALNSIPP